MLHGGYIQYALSGGSAVCMPIRWSTFSGMLHGIPTLSCTTHQTIMTIWIRQQTVDLRSMYLTAVWLCVPGLLCPRDINCGFNLTVCFPWLSTLNYCGLPHCGLLFPDGFSLCHELSTDYQLWITLLWSCILLMDSLCHELSTGLPRCGLLSPDEFSLCHELSTVDYLAAVCFLLMDSLSAIVIINRGLPYYGVLSNDGFTFTVYAPWIISCHLCHGVSAIVFMNYLLSATVTMANWQLGSSICIR